MALFLSEIGLKKRREQSGITESRPHPGRVRNRSRSNCDFRNVVFDLPQ